MELIINLSEQWLELRGERTERFPVSTARNGAGQAMGSEATPLGQHLVRARFGEGLPEGAVFSGRKFAGEICDTAKVREHPQRDWVLTRILWLGAWNPVTIWVVTWIVSGALFIFTAHRTVSPWARLHPMAAYACAMRI